MIDRRHFLRGSALAAGALLLAPRLGNGGQQPAPKPPEEKPPQDKEKPAEEKPPQDEERLVDADGREYRICPQCAAPMYRQGRTWSCETCGYSYVE